MLYLWPTLCAIGIWWLSTLILMWRLRQPDAQTAKTLITVWVILVGGVVLLGASFQAATPLGACMAFGGAMAIWCWHETVYLLGLLTGPRPAACPAGASNAERFRYGVAASLYHELAVLVTAALIWWWAWDAANLVGAKAFTMLWLLRWSTKVNIFFGVTNLHTEFWPDRLRYLESYIGDRPSTLAMTGSAGLISILAVWAMTPYGHADAVYLQSFAATSTALLLTLVMLGALEHLFLALRVRDEWLWSLAGQGRAPQEPLSVRAALARDGKLPDIHSHNRSGKA
jgi:putative photosynthetic complex assembly protein 2